MNPTPSIPVSNTAPNRWSELVSRPSDRSPSDLLIPSDFLGHWLKSITASASMRLSSGERQLTVSSDSQTSQLPEPPPASSRAAESTDSDDPSKPDNRWSSVSDVAGIAGRDESRGALSAGEVGSSRPALRPSQVGLGRQNQIAFPATTSNSEPDLHRALDLQRALDLPRDAALSAVDLGRSASVDRRTTTVLIDREVQGVVAHSSVDLLAPGVRSGGFPRAVLSESGPSGTASQAGPSGVGGPSGLADRHQGNADRTTIDPMSPTLPVPGSGRAAEGTLKQHDRLGDPSRSASASDALKGSDDRAGQRHVASETNGSSAEATSSTEGSPDRTSRDRDSAAINERSIRRRGTPTVPVPGEGKPRSREAGHTVQASASVSVVSTQGRPLGLEHLVADVAPGLVPGAKGREATLESRVDNALNSVLVTQASVRGSEIDQALVTEDELLSSTSSAGLKTPAGATSEGGANTGGKNRAADMPPAVWDAKFWQQLTATGSSAVREGNGPAGSLPSRLLQQVGQALRQLPPGDSTMRLHLSPVELGRMDIEISFRQGVMTGKVRVEQGQTLQLLQEGLEGLRGRLAEQGIVVQSLELELGQQGDFSRQSRPFGSMEEGGRQPAGGYFARQPDRGRSTKMEAPPSSVGPATDASGRWAVNVVV